ncbi:hypothetical protein ACU4GD_37950 [Cupriavidus basilensis]
MLWYVQQAVPDPTCNTVASTACPTVERWCRRCTCQKGYAQALTKPTGGTIAGENVNLDIAGQLRDSRVITAGDPLNVKAGSIDAAPQCGGHRHVGLPGQGRLERDHRDGVVSRAGS